MKLTLKHSGIHPAHRLRTLVQRAISPLAPLRQIDEAKVHLTREPESSPPFRVQAQLVTPGPDVFAEARDHTLAAALGKVMKELARAIKARAQKRLTAWKSNPAARPAPLGRLGASPAVR